MKDKKDSRINLISQEEYSIDETYKALRKNYAENQYYTYCGPNAIVFIPPATQPISSSENDDSTASKYYLDNFTSLVLTSEPADIYNLLSGAFFHMKRSGKSHTLFLSGETGSGKSMIASRSMKHLAALGNSRKKPSKLSILIPNVMAVLNAFGEAVTIENDHASQYSNCITLQFNRKARLLGASFFAFGLNKFRITHCPTGESQFHVFRYFLSGLTTTEKSQLRLQSDLQNSLYLSQHDTKSQSLTDNSRNFEQLLQALKSIGVGKRAQSQLFSLLASIIHLGSVQFIDAEEKKSDACGVKNIDIVEFIASLLGLLPDSLLNYLTNITKKIGREQYTVYLNAAGAEKQRDSLARNLYLLLFEWLVDTINSKFSKHADEVATTFNIIDFPGFHNGNVNGFYEYCTNYTNEVIRNLVLKSLDVNADPSSSLSVDNLNDNATLLELFDHPSTGLNSLIYTECQLYSSNQASKDSLIEKFHKHHGSDEKYIVTRIASSAFGIQHYGGSVIYDHSSFLDFNLDTVRDDFIVLFKGTGDIPPTTNPFVSGLFTEKVLAITSPVPQAQKAKKKHGKKGQKSAKSQEPEVEHVETNINNLVTSLGVLKKKVLDTISWVAFCIQPGEKKNGKLDSNRVRSQIRELGIKDHAATSSIYPFVFTLSEFILRYTPIFDHPFNESMSEYDFLSQVLGNHGWGEAEFKLENSRILVEMSAYASIEQLLKKREKEDQSREMHPDQLSEVQSVVSDMESQYSDARSEKSEFPNQQPLEKDNLLALTEKQYNQGKTENIQNEKIIDEDENVKSRGRKRWECCTWCLTWWIPSYCISACGMKRKDIQMAWREKVALNILILMLSILVMFYIAVFGRLICPKESVFSTFEIVDHSSYKSAYVYTFGQIFDVTAYGKIHEISYGVDNTTFIRRTAGKDVSPLFEFDPVFCANGDPERESILQGFTFRYYNLTELFGVTHRHNDPGGAINMMKQYRVGDVVWDLRFIEKTLNAKNSFMRVVGNEVFDLTSLLTSGNYTADIQRAMFPADLGASLIVSKTETDWTKFFKTRLSPSQQADALSCMRALFKVGRLDDRNSLRCQFANYMLFTASCLLVAVILFKFLSALQLGSLPSPEDNDRFVICQVPCYTEDEESLKRTINSLAALRYDDKRKLLFIICDGMIVGSGNDRPTPRIVMDILGVNPDMDTEALSYVALGEGMKQHNMAKVYSGLYEITGHVVPYIIVAKIGKPNERSKPGNRGKRDSQIVLMQFLNRVHYDKPMNPMELEIYHQMKNVIGVNPSFYEYVLMVDADTVVKDDSLNRMVSVCVRDASIMGLCGETRIANEKDSWATMIQVYEYFISHHMAKAFESLFGTVTCLPGCFCMYRIRAPNKSTPLLINNGVIEDYSENKVETLHVKNLLQLGEDRYLTTLMLKHFPKFKLVFTQDAQCETHVPDRWAVLLSQRRRWINSTVHNLAELMFLDQLCGFCCFSMRFIVILDLFATLIMPATLIYLGYLIIMVFLGDSTLPMISLILLASVYALQVIIFILKGQYQHIGWLIIYLLALPVFSLYLPLYAFWHFDDFSWGTTRVVFGENNKQVFLPDTEKFDISSIPHKRWEEYEQELWEMGSEGSGESKASGMTGVTGVTGVSGVSGASSASRRSMIADDYFASHKVAGFQAGRYKGVPPVSGTAGFTGGAMNDTAEGRIDYGGNNAPRYSAGFSAPGTQPPSYNTNGSQPVGGDGRISWVSSGSNPRFSQVLASGSPSGAVGILGGSGDFPTDQELLSEITRILSGADLANITKKKIRDELSAFFKVDLHERKEYINQCIDQCLQRMMPKKKPTGNSNLSFLDAPSTDEVVKQLKKNAIEQSYFTYCGPNAGVFLSVPFSGSEQSLQYPSSLSQNETRLSIIDGGNSNLPLLFVSQKCLESPVSLYDPQDVSHVWQLVSNAYHQLKHKKKNQYFFIRGEAGSGKSSIIQSCLSHVIALSDFNSNKFKGQKSTPASRLAQVDKSGKGGIISKRIAASQALLQAFGNATTPFNPNSTRHGCSTEVLLSRKGKVVGAKLTLMMLEKTRVNRILRPNEKSFHIFYYLLEGLSIEERTRLKLVNDHSHYACLASSMHGKQAASLAASHRDNLARFEECLKSFQQFGINPRVQSQIFQLLSAILHISNIQFLENTDKKSESCKIKNVEVVQIVADLLSILPDLLVFFLTNKTKKIGVENCTVMLNAEQAAEQRDSLAANLYGALVQWIVKHVNQKCAPKISKNKKGKQNQREKRETNNSSSETKPTFYSFGFLDMIPFQPQVDRSRFYELSVNVANEFLEWMVTMACFDQKLQFFRETGEAYPVMQHPPNCQPMMELLERPETGLLSLLHSETRRFLCGQGSDDGLVERLFQAHSGEGMCIPTKVASSPFAIRHYHGQIAYEHRGLLQENINRVNNDLCILIRGSEEIRATTSAFLYSVFTDYVGGVQGSSGDEWSVQSSPIIKEETIPTPRRKKHRKKSKKDNPEKLITPSTFSLPDMTTNMSELQAQLKEIQERAKEADPWFVYCIHAADNASVYASGNDNKDKFESSIVKAQVKLFHLPELIRLTQPRYSVTFSNDEFMQRYQPLLVSLNMKSQPSGDVEDSTLTAKEQVHKIAQSIGWSKNELTLGEHFAYLEWQAFLDIEKQMNKLRRIAKASEEGGGVLDSNVSDTASVFSDSCTFSDSGSVYSDGSDMSFKLTEKDLRRIQGLDENTGGDLEKGGLKEKPLMASEPTAVEESRKSSPDRRKWVCCTWFLTWWIPTYCISGCGMKRKDIQMAWREKVALNILILFLSLIVIFLIGVLGLIICPKQNVHSLAEMDGTLTWNFVYTYTKGVVYDVTKYGMIHQESFSVSNKTFIERIGGKTADPLFDVNPAYCGNGDPSRESVLANFHFRNWNITTMYGLDLHIHEDPLQAISMMSNYKYSDIVWSTTYIQNTLNAKGIGFYRIVDQEVFDLTDLLNSGNFTSEIQQAMFPSDLGASLVINKATVDWTSYFDGYLSPSQKADAVRCLRALFRVGRVDPRDSFQCQFANYGLLVTSCVLVFIIFVKFMAAMQLGSAPTPEDCDRFVILQVPCYTEDEESLLRTINSLASMRYDDKRKLLFIICDGMIIGSGNDRPTPQIVLSILGVDPSVDPAPVSFISLGEGTKQHNMGKVYSGLYEITGHSVPFIVVSKVGKPSERTRPGNRGKRDSQIILMRFLNRVHYDKPMNPLELEMYHQMKNVIGVNPSFYEYILMVDADTVVMKDSLTRLISVCMRDSTIMGLCGETKIANEKESWATMIQVYEYFISHHMSKAFESLFGTVTCLPGCFCMYRIRAPNMSTPLLINNLVLEDYSQNIVETLHCKNLLHLGEDRYLTTLMLKHFPKFKLVFTQDAKCETNVPDQWKVLISQRRRWINSTVHNLFELMMLDQLCGFCCFSMRFIVMMDLFSTLIMPATLIYLGYVIYNMATVTTGQLPLVTICLLAGVYALQIIIFVVKGQYQHIGWLIIYILATPIFSFYLPLYSFWHFDDFSWGTTRIVLGEHNKQVFLPAESEKFDPNMIPHKKWSEYEQEMFDLADAASPLSGESKGSELSKSSFKSRPQSDYFSEGIAPHHIAQQQKQAQRASFPAAMPGLGDFATMQQPPRYEENVALDQVKVQDTRRQTIAVYTPRKQDPGQVPHIVTKAESVVSPSRQYEGALSAKSTRQRRRKSDENVIQASPLQGNQGFVLEAMPDSASLSATTPLTPLKLNSPSNPRPPDLPSHSEIMSEIQRILTRANLNEITKKKIREELSAFFNTNLNPHKRYINKCIDECLTQIPQ